MATKSKTTNKSNVNQKKKPSTTIKKGDVLMTNNRRMGMPIKKGGDSKNQRMAAVSKVKPQAEVNPIVSVSDKNKKATNMTKIDKTKNPFLKNQSAAISPARKKVRTSSEERKKDPTKTSVPVDLNDKNVFRKKVGKLNWKDKKKLDKLNNKKPTQKTEKKPRDPKLVKKIVKKRK